MLFCSHTDEHTNVYIEWNKRFQSQNRYIMEYDDIIPVVRYISTKEELKRVKFYMKRVNINKNT